DVSHPAAAAALPSKTERLVTAEAARWTSAPHANRGGFPAARSKALQARQVCMHITRPGAFL
ncbi:MAG TPA: hypothetical protein VFL49_11225, partial [Pseudolabrys sp.]|nr:hypothetical protein [Pseudolabrys sp.]